MKTVLITGAGIGIGRATAKACGAAGYHVIVTVGLDAEGKSVVGEVEGAGGSAEFQPLDVTDTAAAESVVNAANAKFGALDALICNAGIAHKVPLADLSDEKWDFTFDVDL